MSNKTIIIAIIVVIAILATVYFLGKNKGKQYHPDEVKLPVDIQQINAQLKDFNPGQFTDALYTDTSCYFFCVKDASVMNNVLELSNTQLVAVANDWNKRYFSKASNRSLTQQLQESSSSWNYAWDGARKSLINKLKALGIS